MLRARLKAVTAVVGAIVGASQHPPYKAFRLARLTSKFKALTDFYGVKSAVTARFKWLTPRGVNLACTTFYFTHAKPKGIASGAQFYSGVTLLSKSWLNDVIATIGRPTVRRIVPVCSPFARYE